MPVDNRHVVLGIVLGGWSLYAVACGTRWWGWLGLALIWAVVGAGTVVWFVRGGAVTMG